MYSNIAVKILHLTLINNMWENKGLLVSRYLQCLIAEELITRILFPERDSDIRDIYSITKYLYLNIMYVYNLKSYIVKSII